MVKKNLFFLISDHDYPYETNINSKAYVDPSNKFKHPYYVGSLYGGNYKEMLDLLTACDENIQSDYDKLNKFIAHVHDESHLNK